MKSKILIVDDNKKNIQIAVQILRNEGYELMLALSASEATELLNGQLPDLILLDIMMPITDGLTFCRQLKSTKKFKDIPVIFLTALNDTNDMIKGFQAGGVDYIMKPMKKEELVIRVKNHINLYNARKEIIQLNKNRDFLYSIIAHDLRSSFFIINNSIPLLMNPKIFENKTKYKIILNDLENTASSSGTLLENLLEWTRSQSENIKFNKKIQPVYPIISECLNLFKTNIENKLINIECQINNNMMACFDEISIKTVIRNILGNAIKFTPKSGKIILSAKIEDGFMEIIIEDSGVGMPEDVVLKLKSTNERITTIGTNDEKGSGLGFTLIKDFINKNNAKLEIDSKPGKGTKMKIYLPTSQTYNEY